MSSRTTGRTTCTVKLMTILHCSASINAKVTAVTGPAAAPSSGDQWLPASHPQHWAFSCMLVPCFVWVFFFRMGHKWSCWSRLELHEAQHSRHQTPSRAGLLGRMLSLTGTEKSHINLCLHWFFTLRLMMVLSKQDSFPCL